MHVAENNLCNGSRNLIRMHRPNAGNGRKKRINGPGRGSCGRVVLALYLGDAHRYFGPKIRARLSAAVMYTTDREEEKYEVLGHL